jgi:hypothetical protein
VTDHEINFINFQVDLVLLWQLAMCLGAPKGIGWLKLMQVDYGVFVFQVAFGVQFFWMELIALYKTCYLGKRVFFVLLAYDVF